MQNPDLAASDQPVQFSTGRAPLVSIEHTVRSMKFYNVAEHEMDSLSLLNTLQVGFASAGTLFIGIALPDAYSWVFPTAGVAPVDGKKCAFFVVAALACYFSAWWHGNRAKKIWKKIGTETHASGKTT
jgi:hypothetical protein